MIRCASWTSHEFQRSEWNPDLVSLISKWKKEQEIPSVLSFRRASGGHTRAVHLCSHTLPSAASRFILFGVISTSELYKGTLQGKHILVSSLLHSCGCCVLPWTMIPREVRSVLTSRRKVIWINGTIGLQCPKELWGLRGKKEADVFLPFVAHHLA